MHCWHFSSDQNIGLALPVLGEHNVSTPDPTNTSNQTSQYTCESTINQQDG